MAMCPMPSLLDELVSLARWAPSGDNTQPWRFALHPPDRLTVFGHDTRHDCVYDLRGEATQLSLGALLCTFEIAATSLGHRVTWQRQAAAPENMPRFDLQLHPAPGVQADPLADSIRRRSVQRRPMHTTPLLQEQMVRLEAAAGPGFRLIWLTSAQQRWAAARLLFANAGLRLSLPEAYPVHKRIIQWNSRESEDRIPDQALGASWATLQLMRFGLASWKRVNFFNRWLAGTWIPRIELDLIPAMRCAAHYLLVADHEPTGIDDFVAAGRAVQRVWLTATAEGLWQQPEMTPLIFARYARRNIKFTADNGLAQQASQLAAALQGLAGDSAPQAVWMGRLGSGPTPVARSTRLSLSALAVDQKNQVPTS